MATKGQALKNVMADFVYNWRRRLRSYGVVEYQAVENGGKLEVVIEGATGVMKTYKYDISPREFVYVVNEVIHIPDRAIVQQDGNTIDIG